MSSQPPAPAPSDPVRLAPLVRQAYQAAPLPAELTTLIGREREVEMLADLLAQPDIRLLTLVGPGGVGKSRLALAVADVVDRSYEDGVVLVELAAVTDPALVPLAIAQAIGVRERNSQSLPETLIAALRPRHQLLVLDNLEHLLDSTTLIPHLLAACPQLTVLATSRAALHVSGERDIAIMPLAVPPRERSEHLDVVEASPAVQLFVARAQAVRQDFALTPGNAAAIADICRRVDGLPLALELAAARTRHLPLPTLRKHLDFPLDLLHGGPRDLAPRLRTMRDAIAWSYNLLNEDERAFFRRTAVLAGGGVEEAVAAVSSGAGHLSISSFDGIVALVDMSLLQMSETKTGDARFTMLETIREFGLERLAASGEESASRAAHAAWFLAWAAQAEPYLITRGSAVWVERLALEWPNLRQAVAWALEQGEIEPVLRLAGTILTLAYARGNPLEGEEWLEAALAASHDADPGARVDALFTASALAQVRGDFAQSIALSETGLALAREHGYAFGQARALLALGITAEWQGDIDLAARRYEDARELMSASGHPERLPHWSLLPAANLADIALLRDDPMLAASLAEEAVAGWRTEDYVWGIAQALGTAAAAASALGDQVRASRSFDETLTLWLESDDGRGIAGTLAGIAGVANRRGQYDRAARLLGAAWGLAETLSVRYLAHHVHAERVLAATRAHLDEDAFASAWAAGQRLTVDEAVGEARRALAIPASPPALLSPNPPISISPRELDVLRLLITGNSDRAIAAALRVSPRTVQTHVASLFTKFGVDSRVEVTAAAIRRGIV